MPLFSKITLIIPKLLTAMAVFFVCVQSRIYSFDNFFPALDLMAIYYWCMYKPQLLGNGYLCALGFLKDLLTGVSLGINALTNLIIRMLIVRKEDNFEHTFYLIWIGFAIIVMVSLTIKWLLFSFLAEQWLSVNMAIKQFIVSVLMYPFIHNFFNKIHGLLPRNFVNA